MRQQLVRSTVLAVTLAILIIGLPVLAAVVAHDARGRPLPDWVENGASAGTSLLLMGIVLALSVLALGAGCGSRPARRRGCPVR